MGHFFSAGSGQNYCIRQIGVMKPTRHFGGGCRYPESQAELAAIMEALFSASAALDENPGSDQEMSDHEINPVGC